MKNYRVTVQLQGMVDIFVDAKSPEAAEQIADQLVDNDAFEKFKLDCHIDSIEGANGQKIPCNTWETLDATVDYAQLSDDN